MNHFIVQSKLPSLNQYINACRLNKFAGAKFKKDTEKIIEDAIDIYLKHNSLQSVDEPVKIRFDWHEKTMRRDADNIASAKKYILDAMQNKNILPNDNRKYVKGFYDDIIDDDENYVLVEIKPLKDINEEKSKIYPGVIWLE